MYNLTRIKSNPNNFALQIVKTLSKYDVKITNI